MYAYSLKYFFKNFLIGNERATFLVLFYYDKFWKRFKTINSGQLFFLKKV